MDDRPALATCATNNEDPFDGFGHCRLFVGKLFVTLGA